MTTLCNSGISEPLCRVQIWAWDHLASLDSISGDPRLAIVTLLSQSLNAAGRLAGNPICRASDDC